jgi:hypothetical protein
VRSVPKLQIEGRVNGLGIGVVMRSPAGNHRRLGLVTAGFMVARSSPGNMHYQGRRLRVPHGVWPQVQTLACFTAVNDCECPYFS